jgi:hypothetical protein
MISAAAKAKVGKRQDFIKTEEVKVYPDTTVWIKDFAYFNEPMHNDLFLAPSLRRISCCRCKMDSSKSIFVVWRTLYKNS